MFSRGFNSSNGKLKTMHIDRYRFGHIEIAGHSYDADVIIFPDHVQERWWRREGHRLAQQDLETVLTGKPELVVVGTGYYGRMQVPPETLDFLRAAGIEARIAKTGDAVDEFNRLQQESAAVVAALHLTC
jgi:hypothetical protein